MFLTASNALGHITTAVTDARERIGHDRFQVLSWPQNWSSSACGFGGVACQAFCDAQTVIVSGDDDAVLVYHKGRFAYEVKSPTEKFWVVCGHRQLPGADRWRAVANEYDRDAKPPESRPVKGSKVAK